MVSLFCAEGDDLFKDTEVEYVGSTRFHCERELTNRLVTTTQFISMLKPLRGTLY